MNVIKEEAEKFIDWIKIKIRIHFSEKDFRVKERQIWWASFGQNIGIEQNGKNNNFERPVLIFKKFNKEQFWVLPVSTKIKVGNYYYVFKKDGKEYSVNLSQLRVMSRKRLLRYSADMSVQDHSTIKKLIQRIIG